MVFVAEMLLCFKAISLRVTSLDREPQLIGLGSISWLSATGSLRPSSIRSIQYGNSVASSSLSDKSYSEPGLGKTAGPEFLEEFGFQDVQSRVCKW